MARPSSYASNVKPKLKFIQPLVNAGFSQKDIALMLGINEDTLYEYKKKYKEFSECLKKGDVIKRVEDTFINKLTGDYKSTKEVYEPDPDNPGKMKLIKVEKYETPFKEFAYLQFLERFAPDKWKKPVDSNTDDIVAQFIAAVKKVGNEEHRKDDKQVSE